ncbi:MAG: extracellular solute-binding protein [Clostridia bacterium]|nr:extracellular solute-binding protein [Clostridia bacterium]
MRKQKFTRLACFALAFVMLLGCVTIIGSADTKADGTTDKSIKDYADELNTISYQSYMDENWEIFHNYSSIPAVKAEFDATSNWTFTSLSGDVITMKDGQWTMTIAKDQRVFTDPQAVVDAEDLDYTMEDLVYADYFGGKLALHTPGVGGAEWTLDLAAAGITTKGLYNIQIEYYPIEGKSAAIEREFYLNGKAPFAEARSLKLAKIWSSKKPDATSGLTATYKLQKEDNLSDILTWAASVGMTPTVSEDQTTLTFAKPDVITPSNYPFIERYNLRFFITDAENNELRATAVQTPEWTTYTLKDSGGYFANNFGFVIEPENGKIEISMEGVNERMAIASITLVPYSEMQSYDSYIKEIEQSVGLKPGTSIVKLEAENTTHTSSNGVYPIEDRTSPATSPSDTTRVVLNTIGTEKWSTAGQWVEYRFHVDDAGMYEIYSRFKQSYLDGMYVCRSMQLYTEYAALDNYQLTSAEAYRNKYGNTAGYYNGVPFAEAAELRYDYGTEWMVTNLTAGYDANLDGTVDSYQVYLEKGVVYTLRFEVTLGSMSDKVLQIERILTALNQDYLNIIKLTGTSPEDYIDYKFAQLLPDTLVDMLTQANELEDVSNFLRETAEVASTYSGTCDQLTQLLRKMAYDEDEIARNLDNFKSYVGNLGTFLSDAKTQPLQLDYIMIQPSSAELPEAEAGFFAGFWHECNSFIQSFFRDYNSMGAMDDGNETTSSINVWLAYGRDQSQVIRNLSTNKFTPDTGIAVNLKLVNGGTLLPSILAGMGPDVYLGLGDSTVINYAIRGALTNIEEMPVTEGMSFEDWTMQYFTHASMIQLEIADADGDVHTYGLPETQTFQMMFIRLDILNDLGIEIPKTWEDIYTAQSILESNNMEIGVNTNYKIFLYQDNGDLYADDGMRINLDSVKGLDAFNTMCNMFTQHSFPYSYNAANRFRTGEMPIILADYTGLYNQLKVFATEIEGKWTFVPVPGTIQEDGSINNTADSTIAAVVMISGIENTAAAWDFMKWYTGDECQIEYANEMVAIIGDSAKQPTANRKALSSLPWTYDEYVEVAKQFENLAAIPNYPGSYYLDRHTEFAFLAAYNDDADPSTEILSYINTINKEITRKREEFKLETLEIGQTLASKRMNQAMNAIENLVEKYGNTKFDAAITATKYAVANQNIVRLNEAAQMFEALRDEAWDGTYIDVVKVSGKTVTMPSYYINVGKQTAEEKDGGYTISSLNELQLLYFIGQSLRDAANALASY